jgi:hypothetical protein
MKTLKISITCLMLFLAIAPMQTQAATDLVVPTASTLALADAHKAQELSKRLDEINAMDKSDMKRAEKRQLRTEVKAINQELKELGGGVYLSVGAVIIIILLLILLV